MSKVVQIVSLFAVLFFSEAFGVSKIEKIDTFHPVLDFIDMLVGSGNDKTTFRKILFFIQMDDVVLMPKNICLRPMYYANFEELFDGLHQELQIKKDKRLLKRDIVEQSNFSLCDKSLTNLMKMITRDEFRAVGISSSCEGIFCEIDNFENFIVAQLDLFEVGLRVPGHIFQPLKTVFNGHANDIVFKDGVLFCRGNSKGRSIVRFLREAKVRQDLDFECVIFIGSLFEDVCLLKDLIDDFNVETRSNIDYWGLNYLNCRAHDCFDEELANFQLTNFFRTGEFIEDPAAKTLLLKRRKPSPNRELVGDLKP